MSDNSPFAVGATAVAEPPAVEDVDGGPRVKPLMVVVAVAVVLALGAAAYFLLFSGGGGDEPSGAVPAGKPAASSAPSASAHHSTAPSAVATAPVTTGRDPFAPLAVPVATVAASGGSGSSAAPSASSSSGSGVTAPAGVTQVVALKAVSTASGSATLTVNNKSYIAHLGESFGTYFQLRGVSATCGYFLYGDMSFQLCGTQKVTLKS